MYTVDMYDVLTFGSVTLDTFITPQDPQEKDSFFVIPVGEKVLLKEVYKSCGGSSSNSSVGFVKLGLRTGTFGFIGDDRVGASIRNILDEEGLDTQFLLTSPHSESSMSIILNTHDGRRSVFNYKNPMEDFDPEHLFEAPETRSVYIGHLTEKSEDFLFALPEWKKRTGGLVTWNPGKTQFKRGLSYFKNVLKATDILILNKEEGEAFTGISPEPVVGHSFSVDRFGTSIDIHPPYSVTSLYDVRAMARAFFDCGVGKVVITDSKRGAQLFDRRGGHVRCAAPDVSVVSTLGAGDAFSVGVVAAELYGQPLDKQILWGAWSSGSVIQLFGAQHGQASLDEMLRLTSSVV